MTSPIPPHGPARQLRDRLAADGLTGHFDELRSVVARLIAVGVRPADVPDYFGTVAVFNGYETADVKWSHFSDAVRDLANSLPAPTATG